MNFDCARLAVPRRGLEQRTFSVISTLRASHPAITAIRAASA
jgi:hypothetical protein